MTDLIEQMARLAAAIQLLNLVLRATAQS